MWAIRSLLLVTLPVLPALAQPQGPSDFSATAEWEKALNELPEESVSLALEHNLRPQYQGGVFENGHNALRAVRSDDPQLASKLVDLARQDADIKQYLKRQNNNSTTSSTTAISTTSSLSESSSTTTSPSPESSSPVPPASTTSEQSIETGVIVPVPVLSTSDGNVIESTTIAFLPSAPTSVAILVTSNGVTSTSMAPAIIQTSTDSQGSVQTTAIPVASVSVAAGGSIVDGSAVTSTDQAGNVVTVTGSGGGVISQLELITTTLSDGMQTIVTSFAEVGGGTSTVAADSPQATDQPDLQSGAAAPSSWYAAEVAVVIGAAIGVAGFVL